MIMDNVPDIDEQINMFRGRKGSKDYSFLEEKLTQKLIALNGIDIKGNEYLRKQRAESLKTINRFLSILESKAQRKPDTGNDFCLEVFKIDKDNITMETSSSPYSTAKALGNKSMINPC